MKVAMAFVFHTDQCFFSLCYAPSFFHIISGTRPHFFYPISVVIKTVAFVQ